MSNFTFIQADFPELYQDALEAERLTFVSAKASAVLMRSALENAVNWLFEHDSKLEMPWRADLSTLMHEPSFRGLFNEAMFRELNLIRKTGNAAAHGTRVSERDALASLKYLFRFLRFLAIYYGKNTPEVLAFDESLVPKPAQQDAQSNSQADQKKLKKLIDNLAHKNELARQAEQQLADKVRENAELKYQLAAQQAAVQTLKEQREKTVDIEQAIPLLVSEAETRQRYIDLALKEAGWDDLQPDRELEYPVTGMPKSTNPSGKGFIDYVLWGDDGLPLAVVEAKKTMNNPKQGKHQAKLYADCLQAETGQRPIIFYSNGFQTYLWDDLFCAEREVQGFYSKDELQRLIARRDPQTGRKDLRTYQVNDDITNRPYQYEAIERVAENSITFSPDGQIRGKSRRSLLVMATGSGKTRTSASLVDMFTKFNWAKRVLFLADRNALVTQAKNAFNELLPNLTAIDLTKEKEDSATRLVFSTYPTIMNRIDGIRNDAERFYGVGHFDLIIIDEAHRSVYQKYKAIFDYFDAMLVGLTATPKVDVDRNTYELFGIEDGDPTYAYELDKAVDQKWLVPPKAMSVPLKFVREGVKYSELSEREKEEYEDKFGDPTTEEAPEEIGSAAINKWLFNKDTVDQVLNHLMTHGIKVDGGDKLGKTIIFAKNHAHAVFIEECFTKNYPQYAGHFLRVIDNYESKAQDLLETFVDHYVEHDPQIAVSVDMMDTGVDAPRVVNLVFFKMVKSATKFWQMVGRGTRLCPDLFGPGQDKTHFVIFDYCQNLEFFEANPDGAENKVIKGLTQRIFEAKLELAYLLRQADDATDDQLALAESYIEELYLLISGLDRDRFVVKAELRAVVEYSDKARWTNLSQGDLLDINTCLSKLVLPDKNDDEFARRFDILLLNYQLALISGSHSTDGYMNRISDIAGSLLKKKNTIPAIGVQEDLLKEIKTDVFWQAVTVNRLDEVRTSLRDLLKYLDRENQETVYTSFKDDLDYFGTKEYDIMPTYTNLQSYKDRVESYIRDHQDYPAIQKLKNNQAITEAELLELESILFNDDALGSKQDYIKSYGDQPLGTFIRFIVGLDVKAAQQAFAEFIKSGHLTADQLKFIDNIISHLTTNGVIDKKMLFEAPFTNIHDQGILGVFDDSMATQIIKVIEGVNGNALGHHNP